MPADIPIDTGTEKLIHFTIVFNTYIFMQSFNQINARKIEYGEFNVFKDFFNNFLFIGITLFTIGMQIVLVQFGGQTVKCSPLTVQQFGISAAFGAGEVVWGFIIKLMPLGMFQCLKMDDKPMGEEETTASQILKRSMTLKK